MFTRVALTLATAASLALPAGATLSEPVEPVDALLENVILTDAIRIEVDGANRHDCAIQVIKAFDIPRRALRYDPQCEVVDAPRPYTSASND